MVVQCIGFIIPLMDSMYANYYTREVMVILIREFQTPDEEMKKIVLKVVEQCVGTEGVEPVYIRTVRTLNPALTTYSLPKTQLNDHRPMPAQTLSGRRPAADLSRSRMVSDARIVLPQEILPDFFRNFWVRRMALDRRNYRQLVDTTVCIARKVCCRCQQPFPSARPGPP